MNVKLSGVLSIVLGLLVVPDAEAFNAAGHKIIAELTWQKLDPATRKTIVASLRQHPRFDEDFADRMDQELGDVDRNTEDHWIFCQASIWPDIARGFSTTDKKRYHRPRWHYINLPVFLDADQAEQFAGNLPANVSFEIDPGLDEEMLNGVQAVKRSIMIVSDPATAEADRAVHYCWLLHVIADLHQPLHSASLFTVELFPRNDRGGNSIKIKRAGSSGQGSSLHTTWDGALGRQSRFNSVLGKAQQLVSDHPDEFAAPFEPLPFDVWSTEVQQVSLEEAYGPLLEDLRAAEAGGDELDTLEAPVRYFEAAGDVAGRQAVIAGVRLAGVLTSLVNASDMHRSIAGGTSHLGFPAAVAQTRIRSLSAAPGTHPRTTSDDLSTLSERVRLLDQELRALRLKVRRLELASPAESRRPLHVHSIGTPEAVDDGEQCDCGADELE